MFDFQNLEDVVVSRAGMKSRPYSATVYRIQVYICKNVNVILM